MILLRKTIFFIRRFSREIIVNHLKGSESGISVVSLNRVKAKNAIGKILLSELRQTISDLKINKTSRVIIIKSSVKGVFCAGNNNLPKSIFYF